MWPANLLSGCLTLIGRWSNLIGRRKSVKTADLRVHASLMWIMPVHKILNGVFLIEMCRISARYLMRAFTLCCLECMTVYRNGKVEVWGDFGLKKSQSWPLHTWVCHRAGYNTRNLWSTLCFMPLCEWLINDTARNWTFKSNNEMIEREGSLHIWRTWIEMRVYTIAFLTRIFAGGVLLIYVGTWIVGLG
jgi:hypothetical protein